MMKREEMKELVQEIIKNKKDPRAWIDKVLNGEVPKKYEIAIRMAEDAKKNIGKKDAE